MPFSADYPRDETFALGVIGGASAGFPDTLRQFRAQGTPRGSDSLSPLHTESTEADLKPVATRRRLDRFWTSLVVGFGVGVCAAVVFGARRGPKLPVIASTPSAAARPAAPPSPPLTLPGCVAPPAPVSAALPQTEPKPVVTPLLEKRFWLERARSAQHHYRLAEAERAYRRALVQAPRDSEALAGLGEIELLRGRSAAADSHFRAALEANPDYLPARVALADLHWQSGQAEAARHAYQQIVEQYSADLLPPYVSQRLDGDACVPQCGEASPTTPASALEVVRPSDPP